MESSDPGRTASQLKDRDRRFRPVDLAAMVFLALLTTTVATRQTDGPGFPSQEAPLHVMNGVFLHDWLTSQDHEPVATWTAEYCFDYPCVTIFAEFPPLFYFVEAVSFVFFGVSVWVARLLVVLFAIGSIWLLYEWTRWIFGRPAGFAAGVLGLASPAGAAASGDVLLAWPAMFFMLLAIVGYVRYLERPRWQTGILAAIGCAAAFLTWYAAAFAIILIVVHAWWDHRGHQLKRLSFIIPLAMAGTTIVGYAWIASGIIDLNPKLLFGDPAFQHLRQTDHWIWHMSPHRLARTLGTPLLLGMAAILIVGLGKVLAAYVRLFYQVISKTGDTREPKQPQDNSHDKHRSDSASPRVLPVVWLFLWWLICTSMAGRFEQSFFVAVPAVACLVPAAALQFKNRLLLSISGALLTVICVAQLLGALEMSPRQTTSAKSTIRFLAQQDDAEMILMAVLHEGQFVLDLRTESDATGSLTPVQLRTLLSPQSMPTTQRDETRVPQREDLLAAMDTWGIRYVVLEAGLSDEARRAWETPSQVLLRSVLQDPKQFELVYAQPSDNNETKTRNPVLLTYRYLHAKPRRIETITVFVPPLGREIQVHLPRTTGTP